jgi:hypothetical protein
LPGVAQRLHHCRDLGTAQPFDFLTWFEYSPEHEKGFEQLVRELRETEEWNFVRARSRYSFELVNFDERILGALATLKRAFHEGRAPFFPQVS